VDIRADISATRSSIQRWYTKAAVLLLNTTALFLLVNGLLAAFYAAKDRLGGPGQGIAVARHGMAKVALAYPGWQRQDLVELLRESERSATNEYEPYTEFRLRPQRGRFVNVSGEGYRLVRRQGPWPPARAAYNVFVFGGSTTFGMGVPDADTIPSLLADQVTHDACGRQAYVYNFGRPGYLARQEAILYEQLLLRGAVPDLAIFVDGLNEFYVWPRPLSAERMRASLAGWGSGAAPRLLDWLCTLPLGRLAQALQARLAPDPPEWHARERDALPVERVIEDWKANARLVESVARAHGARCLFVWQPVPAYQYDSELNPFFDSTSVDYQTAPRMRRGYELLDAERRRGDPVPGFLWLADLQQGRRENLYVSEHHYRPVLAAEIARRIAQTSREEGLLGCVAGGP
jgi:hypothetical protein